MLGFRSIEELVTAADAAGVPISTVTLESQAEELSLSVEKLRKKMHKNLVVMREAAEAGLAHTKRSHSGLSGGDAKRLATYLETSPALCGSVLSSAIIKTLAVSEHNAAMGRIVAAPTAGSCGVLPGAILSVLEERNRTEEEGISALVTAGAVGMVIAARASVSGAEGGCQAECGSAAAMAAAAIVELCGGTPAQCGNAVALAIKSILGLVCDPVAGLVEVPCVKRNASSVAIAFTAAELSLAGVESLIPPDEVIDAMRRVGRAIPPSLRETSEGGLATTPTGCRLREKIFQ